MIARQGSADDLYLACIKIEMWRSYNMEHTLYSDEILRPLCERELNEFLDTKECAKTEFQCINGEKCIDKQNVCNGYFDCQGKFILEINFENSTPKMAKNGWFRSKLRISLRNRENLRWF